MRHVRRVIVRLDRLDTDVHAVNALATDKLAVAESQCPVQATRMFMQGSNAHSPARIDRVDQQATRNKGSPP